MIIIIRALPQWGKDDGDYDPPQVGMRLRTKKKEKGQKKRRPKKGKKKTKK